MKPESRGKGLLVYKVAPALLALAQIKDYQGPYLRHCRHCLAVWERQFTARFRTLPKENLSNLVG
jgi:hypothetical protein